MENKNNTPSGIEVIIQIIFLGIMFWCMIQSIKGLKGL